MTSETLKSETPANDVFMKLGSLLSMTCRHRPVQTWNSTVNSECRIIEVVLGTECSDYDRRTGDNKTRPNTGAGSSHRKSVLAPFRFVILHSVYDSLDRLGTEWTIRLITQTYLSSMSVKCIIDLFRGACAVKGNVQVAGHVKRINLGDVFDAWRFVRKRWRVIIS